METSLKNAQHGEIVRIAADGTLRVSSIDIANHFGKRHAHTIRLIKKIIEELPCDFTEPNFGFSEYYDDTGRKLPCYSLTRDAFTLVAMSFTGKTALAWKVRFIQAFNAMEKELQKQQHNKNFEMDAKGIQISPLLPRTPCTDEQLDALRGLVYLMSQFDDTSEEEAETVLCHALRIEDLSQLAVSDFNYAFDHCWRYIHRFYPSQRGPSDPADMNVARRLISLAAYQSGAPRQSITDYVCHMCNIRSLEDGAQCSAKVILAILGVLVRVADDKAFRAILS